MRPKKSSCMTAKSHSANRRAKEKTCAHVRVCAFDNASKTIVIAHVCPCEFSEMPRCIVFDSWPHVVHQFPVRVVLFRSPWSLLAKPCPTLIKVKAGFVCLLVSSFLIGSRGHRSLLFDAN